jgi:hypothetical protein
MKPTTRWRKSMPTNKCVTCKQDKDDFSESGGYAQCEPCSINEVAEGWDK